MRSYSAKPKSVFIGAEETVSAFKQGKTFNVLMDRYYDFQRFLLRDTRDGGIDLIYASELQMLENMAPGCPYYYAQILECQQTLHFLSKVYGRQRASFTLVARNRSTSEDEFIKLSGGLGGFWSV